MSLGQNDGSWTKVGPYNLTANGSLTGQVSLTSTLGLHNNQDILLNAAGQGQGKYYITTVVSTTQLIVALDTGRADRPLGLNAYSDTSQYTTASSATFLAPLQTKNQWVPHGPTVASYEAAPVAALRVMNVDNTGAYSAAGGGGGSTGSITILNPSLTVSIGATTAAGFQYAQVNAISITAGNSSQTTGFPIMTLANNSVVLQFVGNMSVSTGISVGGTVATSSQIIALPPAGSFSIDFGANSRYVASGQVISLFSYNASVTATGFTSVTAVS